MYCQHFFDEALSQASAQQIGFHGPVATTGGNGTRRWAGALMVGSWCGHTAWHGYGAFIVGDSRLGGKSDQGLQPPLH